MKSQKKIWIIVVEYSVLVTLIGVVLFLVLGIKEVNLSKYPISYSSGGDAVTGLVTAKSMQQNGWIYQNPYVGAPYGLDNYDAVTMEILLSFWEQFLVWMTGNWILAYNLFYISSYIAIGITAYYTLKQLKITPVIALPLSLLYSFAPYHQMRGVGHLYLGMYFMVPLMVLYAYRLLLGEELFGKGSRILNKNQQGWLTWQNIIRGICLICMALSGIYYAFYACFFFCVALMIRILNGDYLHRNEKGWRIHNIRILIRQCLQPLFCIVMIVFSLCIAAIPNVVYWLQNGRTGSLALKGKQGAEIYALKIVQLLLPIPNHRISFFAKVRNFYDSVYPLVNENGCASLGVIMSLGFVILCMALFFRSKRHIHPNIYIGSLMNISAVLFGTIGGFSAVMSFFTGAVRCHNRISIFIAMISLIAIAQVIQMMLKNKNKGLIFFFMIVLLIFGIYDQTVSNKNWHYQLDKDNFEADHVFIGAIEQEEEDNAMIYQMPYMKYPENGGIQNMTDYSHFVGYIHSDTLRWSYGAIEGRKGDEWFRSVNELSIQDQIRTIKEAGFSGIYVDWNSYLPDERSLMEEQLLEASDNRVIMDQDAIRAYYPFRQYE